MIEIIKYGKKQIVTCDACGCIFTYEKIDVKYAQTDYNEYESYVNCPCCDNKIKASTM